ncbi:Fungal-trans multi-domain protein [Pyrenophora tritici-repentis]|uniref:Fungal specific transcription factor domain containing protein n=2 Tax=Pyrenophora tritici-repentis TaxID=45151 RepID=A0A2W1GIZ8_9PLEO|nr:uncharacterized protein PTRG_02928 [Pyrenophora tritici-repentis Pt-1C-BFP]KAA8622996.1 Fungal-trans multi-domain protein [Pyrenophora tritici-repentis]EDU45451.1 predicted protein [Pyrenophora tritici-repentis Pt-1C-BFP]KAF7451985.1 Fungal-trans multi-domain protein [Pyrenophora tritici-repentis]KAF7574894.1 Fungal-trans multi-domain protein [Pyrenophora tritici-repentis]KAG9386340.1 Fungal-trans multi-domain protein [Pyrenophora tritici-repentis]
MSASTPAPNSSNASSSRRVPLDKRKRTETSCDKCKSRKQKCRKEPGQDACRYCIVHNIECLTTQPRKKRLYGSVEGLGTRLALLESLVKGLLPEADVSSTESLRQLAVTHGIPLPDAAGSDGNGDNDESGEGEGDDTVSLLPDQQGQVQYIGPGSSLSFHFKLRALVGRSAPHEFVLFGKNAAAQASPTGSDDSLSNSQSNPTSIPRANASRSHQRRPTPSESPNHELLIRTFFDHIQPDFPVLHEPSFREAYDAWLVNPKQADPSWLCSFMCMLLLARRVARIPLHEDQEQFWWQRVQKLLPLVIFTSSITAVQALLLTALHLHNTNHRDACWNLTGTAVRIAHAIGLHQDKINAGSTPLGREVRKILWWTLYGFETLQVSSYDRPSAIEHPGLRISYANERIIGGPPDFIAFSTRLFMLLGSACRAPRTVKFNASDESYVGPLSPAAGVLRDLVRWKDTLPQHLRVEAVDTSASVFQRALMLMHASYHYTIIVLCRSALLARASILTKTGQDSTNSALTSMADACSESGRELAQVLLKVDALGKFDAVFSSDTWYMLASSSALVLDLVCLNKLGGTNMSESRILLSQLADLAQRHRRNPYMPGTIEKFASLVPELHSMADSLASPVRFTEPKLETHDSGPQTSLPPPQLSQADTVPHIYHQSPPGTGAYMFADHIPGRMYPDQPYMGTATTMTPNTRFDRATQMQFMDFTINNINDWNWGDIGGLLGSEDVPTMHGNPHVHGPQPTGPN